MYGLSDDIQALHDELGEKDKRIAELETALAADLGYTELPDCIKRDPVRDAFLIRQADQLKEQRERNSELDRTVTNQYNTIAKLEAKTEIDAITMDNFLKQIAELEAKHTALEDGLRDIYRSSAQYQEARREGLFTRTDPTVYLKVKRDDIRALLGKESEDA